MTHCCRPAAGIAGFIALVAGGLASVSAAQAAPADGTAPVPAVAQASGFAVPADVQTVLADRCISCHGETKQKGKVRLDTLASLVVEDRLDLLNKMQEAVHLGEMPPEEEERPSAAELARLNQWLSNELSGSQSSKLEDKLRYPDYGNYVNHEKLFSGQIKDKSYTPARRWLVSPLIFEDRVLNVFALQGRERDGFRRSGFYGVTNPFVLTDHSGVRDYDIGVLDGGHLLVMRTNADWISTKQIHAARVKNGEASATEFENPKDRWFPKTTPATFEAIILKKSKPTDAELVAAIQTQFGCVLGRPAGARELENYLELTRSAIDVGGNTEGLRQMLVAVLLESEFLYRVEFGAGEPDEFGRKKLSPREASYAISYALGDRAPDAALLKAADEGRLVSNEDYKREVLRLLADTTQYSGQVDKTLNGKNYQSNATSHPKIVRFFREFFGYPTAVKVFKDIPRSDGIYQNPDRGTSGTPGRLILETDRIVTMYVEQDRNVLENLLTSDQFFVYHDKDDETGRKIIEEWRGVYEKLKDSDWKRNPQKVFDDNADFLKARKTLNLPAMKEGGALVNYMHFFEESFGQGRTPFTTVPWAHGYYFHHAPLYNLGRTPEVGRYGDWRSTQYTGKKLGKELFWDYPTQQPFRIERRMGILTHPSWLIAHSSNFHTDPIRRGRWIREKLLAGRVPDVPITVDAQVPEHSQQTFRERVEAATSQEACWRCHQQMNPLGLAFEMYDDFGRYRTVESLEYPENLIAGPRTKYGASTYKTKPVDTTGVLSGTGDPALDGEVTDAIDMIGRLAKADRVRQSIIRHAFRFYMGRNETLADSQTLIDADKAYIENGGSFKAVIVSLLSSDSFIYRK